MRNRHHFQAISLILFTSIIFTQSCTLLPMEEMDFFEDKTGATIESLTPGNENVIYTAIPSFFWDLDGVKSVDIQISNDESFDSGNILASQKSISSGSYDMTENLPGIGAYYWRLKYTADDGLVSPWDTYTFYYLNSLSFDSFEVYDDDFSTYQDWSATNSTISSKEAHDGSHSARLGGNSYSPNTMSTNIELDDSKILSFWVKSNDSNYHDFYFYVDDNMKTRVYTCNISSWTYYQFVLDEGSHELEWNYDPWGSSESYVYVDEIMLSPALDFSEALASLTSSWFTVDSYVLSGDSDPYALADETLTSGNYITLGDYGSSGENSFTLNVTASSSVIVSFDYLKVDDDNLRFYIDSNQNFFTNYDGAEWYTREYYLSSGSHSLTWEVEKYYDSETSTSLISNLYTIQTVDISEAFSTLISAGGTVNSWTLQGEIEPYILSGATDTVVFNSDDSDYCTLEASIEVPSDGSFIFDYTKEYGSYLYFYIDGTIKNNLSYSSQTETPISLTNTLTAGTYTLRWSFHSSSSHQSEISNIRFE